MQSEQTLARVPFCGARALSHRPWGRAGVPEGPGGRQAAQWVTGSELAVCAVFSWDKTPRGARA